MSSAMKCDRCGKYYDYYFKREVNGKNVNSQNCICLYLMTRYGDLSDKQRYDLCPECMAKLKEFLAGSDYDEEHNADSQDA